MGMLKLDATNHAGKFVKGAEGSGPVGDGKSGIVASDQCSGNDKYKRPKGGEGREPVQSPVIRGGERLQGPGCGQGLAGIRRYLVRWDGKIAIRSGTARIAIVPKWDDDVPLKDGLPAFPGAQVLIIIPEQGSTRR